MITVKHNNKNIKLKTKGNPKDLLEQSTAISVMAIQLSISQMVQEGNKQFTDKEIIDLIDYYGAKIILNLRKNFNVTDDITKNNAD